MDSPRHRLPAPKDFYMTFNTPLPQAPLPPVTGAAPSIDLSFGLQRTPPRKTAAPRQPVAPRKKRSRGKVSLADQIKRKQRMRAVMPAAVSTRKTPTIPATKAMRPVKIIQRYGPVPKENRQHARLLWNISEDGSNGFAQAIARPNVNGVLYIDCSNFAKAMRNANE